MRVSREKAAENRERVVATAAGQFRAHGFDGIGEVGIPLRAAGLALAGTHAQMLVEAQLAANQRQGRAAHELCAQPAQIAFGYLRETPIDQAGNDEIEKGIAQVFEALIVLGAEAAVRQRQLQQRAIAKLISKLVFWRWLQQEKPLRT